LAIEQHLQGSTFDADTVRIMIDAYETICRELNLARGQSPTHQVIADKVLLLAKDGERDPQVIVKRVLLDKSSFESN
jgi:hypothetical protein